MRLWVLKSLALVALLVGGYAQANAAADPALEGFWRDSDGEVILEVLPCAAARCAKVVWLKSPLGPDGMPLLDHKNSDPKLAVRPVCGMDVITGMEKQSDGSWGGGTVYVPDLGMSFSGKALIQSPTEVKVTGYVGIPLFGASEVWTKVAAPADRCDAKPRKPVAAPNAPPPR